MAPLPLPRSLRDAATGASWLALVAATSLGVSQVSRVRAQVSGEVSSSAVPGEAVGLEDSVAGQGQALKQRAAPKRGAQPPTPIHFRLIAHTYQRSAASSGGWRAGRPLASVQREVTAAELREGLSVDLVSLGVADEDQVVVAWVEPGSATLELDGLTAVPPPGAHVAVVRGQLATLTLG